MVNISFLRANPNKINTKRSVLNRSNKKFTGGLIVNNIKISLLLILLFKNIKINFCQKKKVNVTINIVNVHMSKFLLINNI